MVYIDLCDNQMKGMDSKEVLRFLNAKSRL